MEETIEYEFEIEEVIYILKIEISSSDKLLFTLKKKDDNELTHYKRELKLEELLEIFALKNKNSNIEKIFQLIKRSKAKNRIKIKIENDNAKFILIKENEDLEYEEYPFDLIQCAVAEQELNKTIVKDLKEIRDKIKDILEIQIEKLKEENKKMNDEIKKITKENQELKNEIAKLKKNEKNEIDIMVKVDKDEDINKNINFLGIKFMNNENNNNNENLNELIDVYINDKKLEQFQKFFFPEKKGAYRIKLLFKKLILDCSYMFADCKNIININFKNFNSKEVKNMKYMFTGCANLEKIDLSSLDTKNVIDMEGLFGELNNISKEELYLYDADKFSKLYKKTYEGCSKLKEVILCETENVKNMAYMFSGCKRLENLDFSSFYTKNVTDMTGMFFGCSNLEELNLSFFDTENVTNMAFMFYYCSSLTNINISTFNTEKVTNMFSMFHNCYDVKELNLSSFNTKNVTNMASMFYSCRNLTSLDLSKFDTINVTNMSHMFCSCRKLPIYTSFDTTNLKNAKSMFSGCGSQIYNTYNYHYKPDFSSTKFKKFDEKELLG